MAVKESISTIIPCFNEEESIPLIYDELKRVLKDIKNVDYEIIFVDDGSSDHTSQIVKDLSKKDKKVKNVIFSRNFGKEAAMYAGLEKSTGDFVAILDADMQDPPELLKTMYQIIKEENVDCVALYTKSHKGYSFVRRYLTNCWYKIIESLSSSKQMPGARDFRLMKRKMVDAILSMKEYNRYLKGIYGYIGYETKWLPYDAPDRQAGKSKFNIGKLIQYGVEGIVAFSTTPLLFAAYVGLFFCIVSFLLILVIIIKTLIWGDPVSGWPSLACLVVFIGGLQLFFLGILGLYISKLYLEVKKRPIYIEKGDETNETSKSRH